MIIDYEYYGMNEKYIYMQIKISNAFVILKKNK